MLQAPRALVPYVLPCPTCPTCPTCLVPYVLSCPTCLVSYKVSCSKCLVSYVLLCLTYPGPYVLPCFTYLKPYVFSCLTCFVLHVPRVSHFINLFSLRTLSSLFYSPLHILYVLISPFVLLSFHAFALLFFC